MAGRRLSSNDVSVVIALAIVMLVLLLIVAVEHRAAQVDPSPAAAAVRLRPQAGTSTASPLAAAPSVDVGDVAASGSCAAAPLQLPGRTDEELAARQRDEAVQAILATLDARADARARAAGLYFRAARDRFEPRSGATCKERPDECAASEQRHRDDRGSADALARLAVESGDPQVYSWAYRSCAAAARDSAGSCQLINALQWARLDPANAEPWFAVAREARSRRDGAAVDDAMFHVAAASVNDAGWGRLVEQVVKAAPQDERLLVGAWLASADAQSYETLDLAVPDLSRYCDARALANANRRDTCERIATLLVDRSTTLIGRSLGVDLARRLDWAAARLAAVEEENDAARAVESREALSTNEPPRCDDLRRELARLAEVGRLGEVEAMRRRLAGTGEPIAALAEQGRRLARAADVAPAAQGAASAASAAAPADPPSAQTVAQGR